MFRNILIVGALILGFVHWWSGRPVSHAPGQIAPLEPLQTKLDAAAPIKKGEFDIHPLAEFQLQARVLGREDYYLGRESDLSPIDLALGWGPMSDSAVLENIDISQSGRFYFWRANKFPIPHAEISRHSANMHMIPADAAVADRLKDVREGDVVALRGFLVRVESNDNWRWNSSLSRDDTGNGACELVWVRDFTIL